MAGAVLLVARILVAAVLVTSGVAKLFDRTGSADGMRSAGVPRVLAAPAALVLPPVELLIAVLLIPGVTAPWAAAAATTLFLVFAAALAGNLALGRHPDCHCFGRLHSAPAGWGSVARDVLLAGIAAGPALFPAQARLELTAAVGSLSGAVWVAALVGANAVLLAMVTWVAVSLMRQNGRLLLRVERLESLVSVEAPVEPFFPGVEAAGGAPAPAFEAGTTDGGRVRLDDLLSASRPVLMVFVDPECGPCRELMPDVAAWRSHTNGVDIVPVSAGKPRRVAELGQHLGLDRILLDPGNMSTAFGVAGTPAAVLLSADGRITARASGADAIRALHDQLTATSNGHRTVAAPLRTGDTVRGMTLPRLDGGVDELAGSREAPTLVVFWNPQCGFCERLIPDLRGWASDPDRRDRLVLVSTGTAGQHAGMDWASTILLDADGSVFAALGANGTPGALRLSADGDVLSEVASGGPAVMALAREGRVEARG